MKVLTVQFSPVSHYFSVSVPNIILSTPLSNSLSLCSVPNKRKQVLHPFKTGKINKTCQARENIFTTICAAVSDKNKQYAFNFTLLIMPIQSNFSSLHNHIQHDTLPCHDSPLGIVTSISPNLIPSTVPLTHIKQVQFSLA